ncbi:MAG: B12-binding domain-containing radical SAM protein [Clostridiales bacterium]|jgi:radical SAM superfamily enzyme YgiQ (UPF0313 family)|nr:B12-binding domain-containing radical SAM protein [Clostridiales bacterium]
MKIVFINPVIDKSKDQLIWASALTHNLFGRMTVMPKLAPMVLAARTPPQHTVEYIDEDIEDIDVNGIKADLIAITAMTVQIVRAYQLADAFRKRGIKVALGGIHASSCPDEAAQHADAVCVGEADNSWPELIKDLENGCLKPRYDVKDYPPVTELVSPRVDIIKHKFYSMFPVQATKGCPHDCDFCCINFSSGHKYRMKPVEQVVAEIRAFEKYNKEPFRKRYHFVDDNLYVNREYTIKLFTAIKELKIKWMGMGSLNIAGDDEVLRVMAESGCKSFSIGYESISDESLAEANKSRANKVSEYQTAADKLIKHGIIPAGYFIFGFDSDDEEVFARTVAFTRKYHILTPYFNILTPFPGTRLYDRVKERIFDKTWSHYGSLKCVFKPAKLQPEQIEAGSYWASRQAALLDDMKRQLMYFWSQGPWETNPPLRAGERFLLRAIGFKVRRNKQYRDFLVWASKQKNAVDLFQIVMTVTFDDMAKKFVLEQPDGSVQAPVPVMGK